MTHPVACPICEIAVAGTSPRFCSTACRADGDLELRRLARRRKALRTQLRNGPSGWRLWTRPSLREQREGLEQELAAVAARADTLLTATLHDADPFRRGNGTDDPGRSTPGGHAPDRRAT